ncbi:MAG: hypothetical protein ACE5KM_20975, partial [Planctomycetaceae bacterium]
MLLCSPFNSRSRVAWWSAVAFALIVVPAQPQEKSLPAGGLQKTQAKAAVTVKLIEARIASAKQGPALKDKPDALKRVLALYEQAKTHLDRAAGFRKQLAGFQTLQKNVAALVEEQRRKLERPISDPDDDVPRETPLDELEQKLASAQQRLKTAQQSLAGLESLRKTRAVRRTDVPRRLAAAKKELAAVDVALTAKPAPGELPEAALAQQTVQQAKRQNLTAEIAALEAEVPTYDITAALLKLQIQVADRDVQRAERAAKFWEKLVEERRGSEADQQQRAASDLLRQLRDNALPKRLIALAEENLKFAKRRTGPDGLVVRIRQATASRHVTDDRLKALQAARKDIDEKLKIPGIEDVIGQLLLDQRRQLPNAGPYERSIGKRRRELSLVRLDLLRLQKEADPYSGAKVDESIRRVTASLAASRGGAYRDNLEQWVRAVLTQRQKLLESLIGDETSLLKHLTELSATERQLVDTGADFQRLIDK